MLELLAFLRANGFRNYIVTGGGIEFVRQWGERVYGVTPEQVIGSSIKTKFELRDGKPVLMRLPHLNFNNDKAGKPITIHQHVGRAPIAAFGNSEGDRQMLEYTTGGDGARFGLLVLHDDATREYAYGPVLGMPRPPIGAFTHALYEQAQGAGWTIVSMKNDWKQVFPFEPGPVIDPLLIDYVSTFVQKSAGEHFSPHVTTGIAPRDYPDTMLAEPFESFTFSPAGAALYQRRGRHPRHAGRRRIARDSRNTRRGRCRACGASVALTRPHGRCTCASARITTRPSSCCVVVSGAHEDIIILRRNERSSRSDRPRSSTTGRVAGGGADDRGRVAVVRFAGGNAPRDAGDSRLKRPL